MLPPVGQIQNVTDRFLRQPIPVPGNGQVTWDAQTKDKVSEANRIAVAQQELSVTVNPDCVNAIIVPIPGHRSVARDPIIDLDIGKACGVCVLQVERSIAGAEDTGRIEAIAIPIASDPHIARDAQGKDRVGDAC
jgi:hypothetical protein